MATGMYTLIICIFSNSLMSMPTSADLDFLRMIGKNPSYSEARERFFTEYDYTGSSNSAVHLYYFSLINFSFFIIQDVITLLLVCLTKSFLSRAAFYRELLVRRNMTRYTLN